MVILLLSFELKIINTLLNSNNVKSNRCLIFTKFRVIFYASNNFFNPKRRKVIDEVDGTPKKH